MFDLIYIVFGGETIEREGSIISSAEVARALDRMNIKNLMIEYEANIFKRLNFSKNPLIFICIHGKNGEDGLLASICNKLNIKYTFSSEISHARAFNKILFKKFLITNNEDTPKIVYDCLENKELIKAKIESSNLDHFIIKPVFGGGSLGIIDFYLTDPYMGIINNLKEKYRPYFIEEFVTGKFITAVVSGDSEIDEKLNLLEVSFDGNIYDYSKKHSLDRKYIIPADIDNNMYYNIKTASRNIYHYGKFNSVVRFDYIVTEKNYYCLEANTIPGLSKNGNLYTIWENAGYSYEHLIEYIINSSRLS